MLLVKLALYISWVTIMSLNAILLIVAGLHGATPSHTPGFGVLVNGMYLALMGSSAILGYMNWQQQQKIWAMLFAANWFMVLIPTIIHVAGGTSPPAAVLILLDLYWLNLYLLYVAGRHRKPPRAG